MRKLLGLAISAVILAGCDMNLNIHGGGPQVVGSGKVGTISRKVGSFKSVSLEGSIDADVTIGRASDAQISGDDNLINLVKTEIKGDTLHIYLKENYTTKHPIKVTVSATALVEASIAGSGDLKVNSYRGSDLKLSIAGSGDISVAGSADALSASIAGSGDMNLYGLKVAKAKVDVAGSGDVNVSVSDSLNANIAGSGDIHYKGHPRVTKSVAGSGDVSGGE